MLGLQLAILEIFIIFYYAEKLRHNVYRFSSLNVIVYYWLILTIVTGFLWETSFVFNYKEVSNISKEFIKNQENVWTKNYDLTYILPWKFSKIFYGDYAAWADREYMDLTNDWSRSIESTHAIFSGLFAFLALYNKYKANNKEFILMIGISMGSQLMNSILYMIEYVIQTEEIYSVNYNSKIFPTGILLFKRPFMWVNLFWTLMPSYTIAMYLKEFSIIKKNKINRI